MIKKITKIVKNNYKIKIKIEFHKIININAGNNLLMNIFIGKENSNILLFKEEEKRLVIPNKYEKQLFEDFYNKIDFKNIRKQCSLFNYKLFNQKILFGMSLTSKTYEDKKKSLFFFS